ncbi:putative bifunctional diguanylate cyclase/phosphodiesterase [Gracilibacillus xinjiangensis]|uniref:Bifunctional diguanylate cyclase/phosphodiesterase n=1 Tax=Gracilibacillus xinjiangensis TaxID=1193282 RepID=A0ABV8WQ54_9BACI
MIGEKGMEIEKIDQLLDAQHLRNQLNQLIDEKTDIRNKEEIQREIHEQFNNVRNLMSLLRQVNSFIIFDSNYHMIYTEKEFGNHLITSVFHTKVPFANIIDKVVQNGKWKGKVQYNKTDGKKAWCDAVIYPFSNKPDLFCIVLNGISDNTGYNIQEEQMIEAEYKRMLQEIMNLIFKVRKENGHIALTVMEGKLAKKLNLSLDIEEIIQSLDEDTYVLLKDKIEKAMQGEEKVFKFYYKGSHLYTMLSPLVDKGYVTEVVGTVIDISLFEYSQQQIEHLVTHDTLTGLPNRHKLMKDVELFIYNKQMDKPKAVIYCDLDRLKNINDTLGQLAGDQVINLIAERIKETLPMGSYLYRLDGDEFVVVIEQSVDDVKSLSERVLQKIRQPFVISNHDFYMTATIGISYINEPANKAEEYINRASSAVHYGKIHGGNQVYAYNKQMSQTYNELLLLESDIRKAFKRNEFRLAYQPKVDVKSNHIVGVEALIRWEHGKKGNIPPSTFIPIAEEIGMIHAIGEWVLFEACQQFMRWKKAGAESVMIAVNVSAIELQQTDFLDKVKKIIKETKMDPNYLEIEITENSVMHNTIECIHTMKELRKMGISLSIDDFGTGYSSMGYLQKFPINYLKIDQSFIKDLFNEAGSAEIIKAMIQLGHTFGLKVVAEGVEGEKILQFIREEACDYYQGYFYSKPLDPIEIGRKLKKPN